MVCPPCGQVPQAATKARPKKGDEYPSEKFPKPRPTNAYSGKMGSRQKLTEVADSTSDGTPQCPRCGGSQFTAKRSNKGKVVGIGTLGVAGLIAPKSQLKCVACGMKFKRG